MDQKLNRIYAFVEATRKLKEILKPLWNEYINEQNMARKKTIWAKIEEFETIQHNLNDQYNQRS